MPNIPGTSNILPGVVTDVTTNSTGVAVNTGLRVSCIMGEGLRSEVIVASALGSGKDGFNSTFTSTVGSVGRFFQLAFAPIVSNRTTLFKNGLPLVGLESTSVGTGTFSNAYDYRINITTGRIELQQAHLVDQGGKNYTASSLNIGDGYISVLTLVDANAPTETWTIKCVSVQRTSLGARISGTAKFIAFGSISGNLTDSNGNIITWTSNGTLTSNGILSFEIFDGLTTFQEGDTFTIKIAGGALVKNDSLTATYIAQGDLNDPTFFTDMKNLSAKHGAVSLDNTLSLGSQLAFDNGTPGVLAMQTAPPLPRRTSYILETNFQGSASPNYDGYLLPFSPGVVPDINSNIHIFVTDPTTGIEKQLLANKWPFYTLDTAGQPTTQSFVFSDIASPAGYNFSYTVQNYTESLFFGQDGYVNVIGATTYFSSATYLFTAIDVGREVKVIHATNAGNIATFTITAVNNGIATVTGGTPVTEHNVTFEVLDTVSPKTPYLVLNHNIVPIGNTLRVTIIDARDAPFFDAGWLTALLTLEAFELDILVPLPKQTMSAIFQNALTHCKTMSNNQNKKERVLFIGAINGLTPDNLTGAKAAAVENIGVLEGIQGDTVAEILAGSTEDLTNYGVPDNFGNTFRCVYFFPDQIVVQVGGDNVIIDGFYLAPAAAGFFSATSNISMPLTNKTLSGFQILKNRQFSNTVIGQLATAGVTVVQPIAGGGRVIWGLTTTQSGFPEEQEISIVFIRDRIAKNFRAGFAGFIGLPEDTDTVALLTARAVSMLKGFIGQKLITNYANLSVARDSVDPRQWNIGVFVQPVYPINWIYIQVGIGTLPST